MAPFSKTPQFHRLDLENLPIPQPFRRKPFLFYFHFSCLNYGYCYLLSLSLIHFPLLRCVSLVRQQSWSSPHAESSVGLNASSSAAVPGNPEKNPGFPRTDERKGEYNQEEEKIAVSVGRQLVVQCGQRGFCFNRVFSVAAMRGWVHVQGGN
jgi:hypothetical protein